MASLQWGLGLGSDVKAYFQLKLEWNDAKRNFVYS